MMFRTPITKDEFGDKKESKTLQFIRSVYEPNPKPRTIKALDGTEVTVPGQKRCIQKLVGSMPTYQTTMPTQEEIQAYPYVASLAEPERQKVIDELTTELAVYLAKKKDANTASMRRVSVRVAVIAINDAANAIGAGERVEKHHADAIWHAMAELGKALKKEGHPKPPKTPKEVAEDEREANSAQGDLLPS